MKILVLTLLLFISFNLSAQKYSGVWSGRFKAGNQKIDVIFRVETSEDDKLFSTLDVTSQMIYDIPMDTTYIIEGDLVIKCERMGLEFRGKLSQFKTTVRGTWTQNFTPFPLILLTIEEPYKRPQTPKPPFPYKIEEVVFENSKANIRLAGTLTIPSGKGKHPVVVLIAGSGPQDRNSTIFRHKPFWFIADYLTREGIAVLRFDERGIGESEGNISKSTSADLATDVVAAVNFLRKHPNVDKKNIGLIGHSEGGIIAPIAAMKNKKVGFIVSLAGPAIPCYKVLLQQSRDIALERGTDSIIVEKTNRITAKLYNRIIAVGDDELTVDDLVESIDDELRKLTAKERKNMGLSEGLLRPRLSQLLLPWMRYFIRYNPQENLKKLKCPLLALNGEKDLQVACEPNLKGFEESTRRNRNAICYRLPNINHLFQTCQTGATDEYVTIDETFSPKVIILIKNWIKSNIK